MLHLLVSVISYAAGVGTYQLLKRGVTRQIQKSGDGSVNIQVGRYDLGELEYETIIKRGK